MKGPLKRWEWLAIALITAAAAALRLVDLSSVSPDPFYDAAVRSMSLNFHNFFFGAFEPGGSVSIDKPPVDLWLQVASVKLLGFSSTTLKLPEVFAGVIAVPLLFAAVRRMWSPGAGIAAAVAFAVLPVEVITARSDTMDAVMMALIVLALLLIVHAFERGSSAWLLAGAVALGLAFNVKLLESLVALPGLAVFAYLGLPGARRRRILQLLLAGVVYLAVALSWLTATLLVPAGERPYAIGSTNGSAWNAAFVFNGTERLGGKSPEPQGTVYSPGQHYPVATQSERDHIPIVPPSATRLLARIGPLSGERLGLEVLAALLLGIPALIWGLGRRQGDLVAPDGRRRSRTPAASPPPAEHGRDEEEQPAAVAVATADPAERDSQATAEHPILAAAGHGAGPPAGQPEEEPTIEHAAVAAPAAPSDENSRRVRRASAAGLTVWMLCGIVLFSHMIRLHPRYVEGFTPVVAAMLGIGVAWAATPIGRWRPAVLTASLLVIVYYGDRLLYGRPGVWWIALAAALAAVALAALARLSSAGRLRSLAAPAGVMAMTLVAVLAIPVRADVTAIHDHVTDAGSVGALPSDEQHLISDYVRAHQGSARYELAAESATEIGSLIVQDARPVLVLTTYNGRVFTSVAKLRRLIAEGKVRYAFLNTFCGGPASSVNPACSAPVKWVRAHGTDVSRRAGLARGGVLYRLPGVRE